MIPFVHRARDFWEGPGWSLLATSAVADTRALPRRPPSLPQTVHPDLVCSTDGASERCELSTERFLALRLAFELLSDEATRAAYDVARTNGVRLPRGRSAWEAWRDSVAAGHAGLRPADGTPMSEKERTACQMAGMRARAAQRRTAKERGTRQRPRRSHFRMAGGEDDTRPRITEQDRQRMSANAKRQVSGLAAACAKRQARRQMDKAAFERHSKQQAARAHGVQGWENEEEYTWI